MLIVLHVMLENQHINTLKAVNEEGSRQAARSFECFLGVRGCLRRKGVKLIPLILTSSSSLTF